MPPGPNEEPFDLSTVPLDIFTELNLMFAPCEGVSKGGIDSVESHLNLLEKDEKITTEAKQALLEHFRDRATILPHEFGGKDSVVSAHIANLRHSIPVGDLPQFFDVEDLISSRLFPNDGSKSFFAIPALKLLATLQMKTSLSRQEVLDILKGDSTDPGRSKMAEGLLKLLGFYLVCDNDEYRLSYNGKMVIETLTAAERIQAVMRARLEKWLKQQQLTPRDADDLRNAVSYIGIMARM